ncbi:MAG TPA: polysaccharide biosynthesis/export family protein [Candidatus Eremiobacteraceae bacterium]|nr:polysaccharide biosynthesis/export family protein [Candidatus Eremiobacteraceae bacterium]
MPPAVAPSPQDNPSVIGTAEETNDRIHSLGATPAKNSPHDYLIGNGDLLGISVFDVPELSRDVRVSQTGTISIPLVPARLHVTGLSETQAEQMIADVLQADGLVSHPEVRVTVKEHKSRPITVVGAVMHPMVYEADQNVTLLQVIAEAGGVTNDAGDTVIVTRHNSHFTLVPNPEPDSSPAPGSAASEDSAVTSSAPTTTNDAKPPSAPAFPSAGDMAQTSAAPANSNAASGNPLSGNIITINLNQLIETGDMQNNISLQAGDVVTVPHAGIVYVLGAVTRPGGFVLANDRSEMTTMKVLALAGGLTRSAKTDHAVIIRKDDQGKQTETEVDLKKILDRQSEDQQMRASDILYIPHSKSKEFMWQALQASLGIGTGIAIYRVAY